MGDFGPIVGGTLFRRKLSASRPRPGEAGVAMSSNLMLVSFILAILVVDVAAILGLVEIGLLAGAGIAGTGALASAVQRRRPHPRLRRRRFEET